MILFCRLAVVSTFTSFLYVHDCPDKHGAQQTHFSVVTGFLQIFKPWRAITIFKYFLTFQVTVKPPVSDHPKCEDSAVAYGRWTLACVASVSVPFRSKEQEREPKTSGKMGRKQHPTKTENPSPRRSSVFLCSEPTRKRLPRSLYGVAYGKWSRIYPQGFLPRRRPNTSTS